jgi:hypothetical protein
MKDFAQQKGCLRLRLRTDPCQTDGQTDFTEAKIAQTASSFMQCKGRRKGLRFNDITTALIRLY